MNTHHYSRRAFLRGTGVTMALPWLESFNVWGDEPKRNKPASEAPVRQIAAISQKPKRAGFKGSRSCIAALHSIADSGASRGQLRCVRFRQAAAFTRVC